MKPGWNIIELWGLGSFLRFLTRAVRLLNCTDIRKNGLKKSLPVFSTKTKKVEDLVGAYNDRKHYAGAPYQSWFFSYKREMYKSLDSSHPNFRLFRPTSDEDLSQQQKPRIYPSQKGHNQILSSCSSSVALLVFFPVKDTHSWTNKTDHTFPKNQTRKYLPRKIPQTHLKYRLCTNIPCIGNFTARSYANKTVRRWRLFFPITVTSSSKYRHSTIYMYFKTEYSTKACTTALWCQILARFSSFISLSISFPYFKQV